MIYYVLIHGKLFFSRITIRFNTIINFVHKNNVKILTTENMFKI